MEVMRNTDFAFPSDYALQSVGDGLHRIGRGDPTQRRRRSPKLGQGRIDPRQHWCLSECAAFQCDGAEKYRLGQRESLLILIPNPLAGQFFKSSALAIKSFAKLPEMLSSQSRKSVVALPTTQSPLL